MNPSFACFGYGSLVNARTRTPRQSRTIDCRLKGWRREWRAVSRIEGPAHCALSVRPDAGTVIDGVLVVEPLHRLPGLDRREAQYDRLPLRRNHFVLSRSDPLGHSLSSLMVIYRARRRYREWGSDRAPVAQSYVDTVLKGFLDRFGEAGVIRFLETTDGWDRVPILRDRTAPTYSRAVRPNPDELHWFHDLVCAYGARFIG